MYFHKINFRAAIDYKNIFTITIIFQIYGISTSNQADTWIVIRFLLLQTNYVFQRNASSGVLSGLIPGTSYVFRLRARNVAGLSQPSNSLSYMPPTTSR